VQQTRAANDGTRLLRAAAAVANRRLHQEFDLAKKTPVCLCSRGGWRAHEQHLREVQVSIHREAVGGQLQAHGVHELSQIFESANKHWWAAVRWMSVVELMEGFPSGTTVLISDARNISRRSTPLVVC
jgi:hypothetical protein